LLGNCIGKPEQGAVGIKWMDELFKRNRDPKYLGLYFYILVRNYRCDQALEVGKEMRANAVRNNQPTQSIDSQIASIDQYRARLAKLEAAKTK
jgi:hypothetical protein